MDFGDQDFKLPDVPGGAATLPTPGQDTGEVPERKPRQPLKFPKTEPTPKEAEPLGFITNLPKSVLNIAKSIFVDLPVAVGTAGYHAIKDPEQYQKDVNLFLDHPGVTGEYLRKSVTDYYTDGFWHNFNEDPARMLQDAATVLDGVGLLGKLGKAGEVGRIAQTAGKVAEYVDPLRVAGKGAKLAFGKALEAFGYGEHTPDIENLAAHLGAKEALSAADAEKKTLFDRLSEPEKATMMRHTMLGVPEEIEADVAKGGPVAERLKKWDDRIGKTEEPFWKTKQLMDDDAMIKAKAKGVNIYSQQHMDLPIPADVAEDLIRTGHLKPTYLQLFKLKNDSLDLFEALNREGGAAGKLARMEKRMGGGQYLTDVDEIMSRQIHSFHQVKYKLGLLDGVKEMMLEKNKLLIAHTPEEIDAAKGLGYRELHDAFYKKYWETYNKATAMQLEALVSAAKSGGNQAEALANVSQKLKTLESLGGSGALVDKGRIFVPAHVAAWLNRELAPVAPFWQYYDKWLSRFKSTVTVFNPRYWAPVIVGNALLGLMYGLSPDMVRLVRKYRGDLPPVLKQVMQHEIQLRDLGIYDRTAKSLGQYASIADNIYRQYMFVGDVVKDSRARTMFNLKNFSVAMENMEAAIAHFSAAPDRYYSTIDRISELRNMAAASLEKQDTKASQLKRLEGRLVKELERLMQEKQTSFSELSSAMDARADAIGKAFGDVSNLSPKYQLFTNQFTDALKELKSNLKNLSYKVDSAGVVAAMDSAIHSVASGHPEWLRYSVQKLKEAIRGQSPLLHKRDRLSILTDMVGAAEDRVKEHVSNVMQRAAQSGQLAKELPRLAMDNQVAQKAIATGNMFYGSFNTLLPFEKDVVKRIIPFYTFTKAMTQLAFKFPFIYPKRSFMIIHLARAWNEIMEDPNSFMPAWSKNYVPVAGMQDGSVMMMRVGSLGPMSNVKMNSMAEKGMPSVYDVAAQNPIIRMMFEMKGGVPEWSAKPLSPGDHAVRLDNGEVIKWTGDGFQKVIAQPSILKSIAYLFPQAQLIDSLFHQYAQTDRGWLFNPQPIQSPNGTIRYPKALLDTILTFAVPTTTVKPQELEQKERVAVALVAKEYEREMRTASPDRRAELIESLRAWAQSRKGAIGRND